MGLGIVFGLIVLVGGLLFAFGLIGDQKLMIGAALGFRVALVMPANVSPTRKQIAATYRTELYDVAPDKVTVTPHGVDPAFTPGRPHQPGTLVVPPSRLFV